MNKGQKYRVIFQGPAGNKEMVARFMDDSIPQVFYFDLRPLAGTQQILRKEIYRIYEVYQDTPLFLPRVFRKSDRYLGRRVW